MDGCFKSRNLVRREFLHRYLLASQQHVEFGEPPYPKDWNLMRPSDSIRDRYAVLRIEFVCALAWDTLNDSLVDNLWPLLNVNSISAAHLVHEPSEAGLLRWLQFIPKRSGFAFWIFREVRSHEGFVSDGRNSKFQAVVPHFWALIAVTK